MTIHERAFVHAFGVVGTFAGFYHCFHIVVDALDMTADRLCEIQLRFV